MPRSKKKTSRKRKKEKKKKTHFIIPIPFISAAKTHPPSLINHRNTTQHGHTNPLIHHNHNHNHHLQHHHPLLLPILAPQLFFLRRSTTRVREQQATRLRQHLQLHTRQHLQQHPLMPVLPHLQIFLPKYSNPSSISYLLNSTAPLIASSNNITDADVIPSGTLITVPVTCSCFTNNNGSYYQHNASYTLKETSETYFTVANNTYQALTTCQALVAQNPNYPVRGLKVGETLHVPLRCACPTKKQSDAGFKYLLTYLVSEGESVSSIAEIFGVDENSILEANEISAASIIFFFTPISVPLKTEPPKRLQSVAAPPTFATNNN